MMSLHALTSSWLHAAGELLGAGDRRAIDGSTSAVAATLAGATPEDITEVGALLAATLEPGPAAALAFLLSAQSKADAPQLAALRGAAAALCESALAGATTGGAAIAIRLARLRNELEDAPGASAAWAEAVRRDARVAWFLTVEQRADPVITSAEDEAAEGNVVRAQIRALARGEDRGAAIALLRSEIASGRDVEGAARIVLAGERLRDAAPLPLGDPSARPALDEVEALVAGLADPPVRALIGAAAAIVAGDRDAARAKLANELGVESTAVESAVLALAELLRRPPSDPRVWLREAYFDALFDPLSALVVPRSPLARLRRQIIGLSIAAMLGSVGCATSGLGTQMGIPGDAMAHELDHERARVGDDMGELGAQEEGELEEGYFTDADDLAAPEVNKEQRLQSLRALIKADVTGTKPGAVMRMFKAAAKRDKDELRYAIADALADADLQKSIEAHPAQHARALEIALAIAPEDPSIKENVKSEKAVAEFSDWGKFPYDMIVVPGYVPLDAEAPVKLHPVAKERLHAALLAFQEGQAPFVLLSGANVHPHDTPYYEAIEMKKALIEMGVPAERILVDARARHSTTNLRNAGRIMLKHGLTRGLITAPGGGLGRFDQAYYFGNPVVSTFHSRCESDLGYQVGELEMIDDVRVAFTPAAVVRRLNYRDALDP